MQNKTYDVVVVGLGTAGAIALMQCAELGLSALGIERLNQMGGTETAGGISSYYFGSTGGVYEKVNACTEALRSKYFIAAGSSPAAAKAIALERMVKKSGAEFVYEARLAQVIQNNNRICGIQYYKQGKMYTVNAKVVIDATGEAETAKLCGCPRLKGRAFDGQYQPYTNSVFVANPAAYIENIDAGHIDMDSNAEMSAELLRANTLPVYLKDSYSADDKIYLANAPLPGVRESARIVGEQTVTLEDALSGKKADNTVFYAYSNVDNHGKDVAFECETLKDWYICAGLWGVNMSVAIPMGAFIPKDTDGLLVGGRALSVTHEIASCVRMKSDMEKSGEIMADMAYLAVQNNCSVRDVPYDRLKSMLESTGCLSEENNVGFRCRTKDGTVSAVFPRNTEELKDCLSSEQPGLGIWAARYMGDAVKDDLAGWMCEKGVLRENAAIALGLLKDDRALPVLLEMAQSRNMRIPKSSIKYVQTAGVAAVYLLGRFNDERGIHILKEIIADGGRFDRAAFKSTELYFAPRDVSFQFVSNAVAALCEIAKRQSDKKEEIVRFITENIIKNNRFSAVITLKGNENTADMAEKIKAYAAWALHIGD